MGQEYEKQITEEAIQKTNKHTLIDRQRYESAGLKGRNF